MAQQNGFLTPDEQKGLLYGSLISAGLNAAMGNDTREAIINFARGGARAYAGGVNALFKQKQDQLENERIAQMTQSGMDMTELAKRRYGLDEREQAWREYTDMLPKPPSVSDQVAIAKFLESQKASQGWPQTVADVASSNEGVAGIAGTLANLPYEQGNPVLQDFLKQQNKPSKEEEDTTKTASSWAEAMFGKKWGELTREQKMAVMEKARERQPMPIVVSTPYVDASSGTPLVMDRQGNMKPANVQGNVQPAIKPTAEMIKAESEITNMQEAMKRIQTNYNPAYVGPVAGRYGATKEKLVGVPEGQALFYADVRSIKDALLRAKSGAQINEQEYSRMVKFLPDENAPAQTFEARMKRFNQELNSVIKGRAKGRTGAVSQPMANTLSPAEQAELDALRKRFGK